MTRAQPDFAEALGGASADKRIDILRRIGEAGSISEAARRAGVSYKAAWQAVETLGNLAGTPLVEKIVGGSGGGGAQLTAAGRRLLHAAEAFARAREDVLTRLRADMGASGPTGLEALGVRTSMRNQMRCDVAALHRAGGAVTVELSLADGMPLRSRITVESVELLGLRPGMPVLALCKAAAVRVAARCRMRADLNVLRGVVDRPPTSPQDAEVSLRLAAGTQVVGLADGRAALRVGQPAMAAIDLTAVAIALPG